MCLSESVRSLESLLIFSPNLLRVIGMEQVVTPISVLKKLGKREDLVIF